MSDGCADLALDIVADNRNACVFELLGPLRVGCDEDRQGVDEGHTSVNGALCVELVGLLGTDRQVGDQDIDLGVLQRLNYVDRFSRGFVDGVRVVLANAVQGRAALNLNAESRNIGDLDGAVFGGNNGLGEVLADLLVVNIESCDELDIGDVVVAEDDVHEARNGLVGLCIAVELDTLHQGGGAVADADDSDAN